LLATGRSVRVRPATADDIGALIRFYTGLSEASSYSRFFGVRSAVPEAELRRTTEQDLTDHVTLVVDAMGELIGVGEYYARPGGEEAEVAFAVADAHHQEGIATLLLEDLAGIAREAGFRRLVAETLPDNVGMQRVFRDVGLVNRLWFEDGAVQVQLDLTAENLLQDHADLRDWKGAVRSLQPILHPRHVVVIVADDDESSPGRRILAHLRASFTGEVSVVEIGDAGDLVPARLGDLASTPDLAIVAIPAPDVADVVEQCGVAGVRSAVVVTPGFAEAGAIGAAMQEQVLAAARSHGMRLVGPNSLGVVATASGLNATYTSQQFRPGSIAIASQSGGVGIAIAAEAERRGAGISSFVSMGNKADVSGNDLLRLWADDDATRVVLLYLESFGDPVRFARVARAVAQRKPIVGLKGGRSESGKRSARSHTAASAGDSGEVEALFAHTGVIRARTMEELIDIGLLLDRQPTPAGKRVGIVGNAGGPLILAADATDEGGAGVPLLSDELQHRLRKLVPSAASTDNPVDAGPSATAREIAGAVATIASSGEVDACVVVCVELDDHDLDDTLALLDDLEVDVPVAVTVIGGWSRVAGRLPTYPTPERAATAMALACGRTAWLARGADQPDRLAADAAALIAARRLARRLAGDLEETTWLPQADAFALLEAAGLDVLRPSNSAVLVADVGQPQVAGVELLVGATRDSALGPFVVVGAGGDEAELRADRALLVAPITPVEAATAIGGLRLAPLLHGYRGRPPLPVDAVVEVVTRVAALVAAAPEIQQLEVNPLVVRSSGCVATGVRIALSIAPPPIVPIRAMRGSHRS
jgi:acyl-CoA synthetase (NDP forming)/RimJ/RimL family protein N-acetyltransferase